MQTMKVFGLMTVLTLLPITLVFSFLQRFITTGIASSGVKG